MHVNSRAAAAYQQLGLLVLAKHAVAVLEYVKSLLNCHTVGLQQANGTLTACTQGAHHMLLLPLLWTFASTLLP
jgi:hypothetical protein